MQGNQLPTILLAADSHVMRFETMCKRNNISPATFFKVDRLFNLHLWGMSGGAFDCISLPSIEFKVNDCKLKYVMLYLGINDLQKQNLFVYSC